MKRVTIFVIMAKTIKNTDDMTFFEHLDDMRPGLIRSVVALLVFMVVAFVFKDAIMAFIMGPKSPEFPTNVLFARMADALGSDVLRINSVPLSLINTSMAGQLNLHLLVSFYAALVVALPYLVFELWLFVRPAFSDVELRHSRMFALCTILSFLLGIAFGYFVLAPLSVNFLGSYSVSAAITNMIDVGSYMSLVLNMSLVCGVVFELPMLVYFLSKVGLVTADFMRNYRRHAIVVLAIGAAIITPPDIVSMVLVIIPLYALYELSIGIAARAARVR